MIPRTNDSYRQELQRLAELESDKIKKLLARINLAIEYGPQVPKDDDEPHKNGKE